MKLRVLSSFLLPCFLVCQLAAQVTSSTQKFSPPTRTFHFTYNFTVKDIPCEPSECASGFRCRALISIRRCALCRSRPRLKRG